MALKVRKKLVVLLQGDGSNTDNKYEKLFVSEDLNVKTIATLMFNYINRDKLKICIRDADSYSGIIFTSRKAVTAVSAVSMLDDSCIENWKNKNNFSVGKATANAAQSLLNLETYGSDSGNSENLCQFIIEKCGQLDKPFLFPCSNIRKDTIPIILSKNGLVVEEVTCYETAPSIHFKNDWKIMISKEGLPEILIFFSPSGVQSCIKTIQDTYPNVEFPKCIALGKSTENALMEIDIPSTVAEKPTPESVLSTVKSLLDV